MIFTIDPDIENSMELPRLIRLYNCFEEFLIDMDAEYILDTPCDFDIPVTIEIENNEAAILFKLRFGEYIV